MSPLCLLSFFAHWRIHCLLFCWLAIAVTALAVAAIAAVAAIVATAIAVAVAVAIAVAVTALAAIVATVATACCLLAFSTGVLLWQSWQTNRWQQPQSI